MIAPEIPATRTAHRLTRPYEARTPPRISAVSPGKKNPRKTEDSRAGTAKTISSASHPLRWRMCSIRLLTVPRVGAPRAARTGGLADVQAGHGPADDHPL